jgi:hypothetical protein
MCACMRSTVQNSAVRQTLTLSMHACKQAMCVHMMWEQSAAIAAATALKASSYTAASKTTINTTKLTLIAASEAASAPQ